MEGSTSSPAALLLMPGPMHALQGLVPEDLARLAGIPVEEARRVVAQVHRGEDPATPNAGIRRASREVPGAPLSR